MDNFTVHIDSNLDDEVKRLPAVRLAPLEAAKTIADRARETAPEDTGSYRDQIAPEATKSGARVVARSNKSAWIEFGVPGHLSWGDGSSPLPATFNLRNAVISTGYKFEKKR